MSTLQLVICMIILTCIDLTVSEIYGTSRIDEHCERDYHCIKNAFCREQRTCLCEPYYAPTPDKGMCTATPGLPCENDSFCATMTNSECVQGVCACKKTFILDLKNSSNCITRPVVEGDLCQRHDECFDAMESALCVNERCRCYASYHFVLGLGRCIRNRYLCQSCQADYECFMMNDSKELVCQNGQCRFKLENTPCSKGSTTAAIAVMTILGLGIVRTIL